MPKILSDALAIILGSIITLTLSGCVTDTTTTGTASAGAAEAARSMKPLLTHSQQESWNLLLGKWYTSQTHADGGRSEWIVSHYPNGTYHITLRVSEPDSISELNGESDSEVDGELGSQFKEHAEFGEWGVVDPVYFTIFKGWVKEGEVLEADVTDPYNRDAYQILSLNETEFSYQSFDGEYAFNIQRVDDEFEFPDTQSDNSDDNPIEDQIETPMEN